MELEKSESVLGNLYTLRGGLSAISVEYDKAQSADVECYEKLDGIAKRFCVDEDDYEDYFYDEEEDDYVKPKGSVEYAQWICSGRLEAKLQENYNFELGCIKEKEIGERFFEDIRSQSYKSDISKYHKKAKTGFIIMAVCFALFTALFIGFICAYMNYDPYDLSTDNIGTAMGFLLFFSVPLFITSIWFMGYGIADSISEKKQKKELATYLEDLQRERETETARVIRERNAEAERVANERNAVQEKYNRLFEALPAAYEEARALLSQRNATISPLTESCNIYHKALTTQFTYLLDERDWQHLDLVIYQLETRRADSIKEALQLVDRELQTERLENSIIAATKSICFTLAHGFAALQNSININCAKICDGLVAMSANINAALSMQSMQLAGISEQLADLTNSANISNALLSKANETSARLVEDVAALRYFNTDMYV